MNPTIQSAINKQINEELFSAYLYLAIASYAGSKGFPGLQNWMTVQAQEEIDHAMGFQIHLLRRGGEGERDAIEKPAKEFGSPLDMVKAGLEHEKHISGCINDLFDLAQKEKDFAFQSFLTWYIDEQVEEEEGAQELIDKMTILGDNGPGVLALDKELAARAYKPSSILIQ